MAKSLQLEFISQGSIAPGGRDCVYIDRECEKFLDNLEQSPSPNVIILKEKQRQRRLINLIPSANYTGQSVLNALGSILQSTYNVWRTAALITAYLRKDPNSEGYIGKKYYPGTQYMDKIERLCQQRALEAFNLNDTAWAVNVQCGCCVGNYTSSQPVVYCFAHHELAKAAYSQQLSCLQACSAILRPHDRLLTLESSHGSYLSKYFTTQSFHAYRSAAAGDYEVLKDFINVYQPRLLLSTTSASNWLIDHQAMSTVCRPLGIFVLADITETSGLVASGLVASPFEHADVVITGTQGSLRGPSGALIFSRRTALVQRTDTKDTEEVCSLGDAINQSVFPGHQGGPHNHAIMAMAVALKQVTTQSFKDYQKLVLANTEALAKRLLDLGYCLDCSNTSTHHLVVRLGTVDAELVKRILDAICVASKITVAENELHIGTLAMTSRGLLPDDFYWVADIIHRGISLAQKLSSIKYGNVNDDFAGAESLSSSFVEAGQTCSMHDSKLIETRKEVEDWMDRLKVLSN